MRATTIKVRDHARRWLLSAGPALFIAGVVVVGRGLSYMDGLFGPAPRSGGHPAENIFSLDWWAVIWVTLGVVCLLSSIRPRQPVASLAFGGAVFVNSMWGFSFTLATMSGEMSRGWVTALGYFAVAAFLMWTAWLTSRSEVMTTVSREEIRDELEHR